MRGVSCAFCFVFQAHGVVYYRRQLNTRIQRILLLDYRRISASLLPFHKSSSRQQTPLRRLCSTHMIQCISNITFGIVVVERFIGQLLCLPPQCFVLVSRY